MNFSPLRFSQQLSWSHGLVVLAVFVVLQNAAMPSNAASATWTNSSGDNLWTNSSNWSAAYPNGASDVASFNNSTAASIVNPVLLGGSITLNGLTFQQGSAAATGAYVAQSLTIRGGSSDTLTLNPGTSYGTALLMRGWANGANISDTLTINANLISSNAANELYLYNGSVVKLAAGTKVSLGASGAYFDVNGDSLTGYGHGTGTLNFNADFDTTNVLGVALRIDAGTVNWNVGTFTNSSAATSLINVTGLNGRAVLNFAKSLVSTTGITGGISLGGTSATNNSNADLYGTANGVVVGANIYTSSMVGSGGKTANSNVVGANDTSATAAARSTITFSGNYSIYDTGNSRTHQLFAANYNTAVFSGGITSINSATTAGSVLQKTGAGTVILWGSAANTSTLPMEVVEGTLVLQKNAGVAALSGSVQVDNGAILQLAASNQIADSVGMTLVGGKFDAGSYSETLGTLNVTAGGSLITLGSGASLIFADSHLLTWSGTLNIETAGMGTYSLRFGSGSSALTTTQLADITIDGNAATIDALGYVTAVPEPTSMAFLGLGLSLLLCRRNRRE